MTNVNNLNRTSDYIDTEFGSEVDKPEVDLHFIISQLRLYRFLLLGSLLFGILLGVVVYSNTTRSYTAHTTLMVNIEGELASQQGSDFMGALSFGKPDAIAPALAISRSTALLEKVVDEREMVNDPEFNFNLRKPTLRDKIFVFIREALGALPFFGSTEKDPNNKHITSSKWLDPTALERRGAIKALKNSIVVEGLEDDLRLKISVTTKDAIKSAELAETMANKLNELLSSTKALALAKAREWIEGEAKRVESALRDTEVQINAEMSTGNISPQSEALGRNTERLVEGELLLESINTRRKALARLGEVVARIEGGETAQQAFTSMPHDMKIELLRDYTEIFRWEQRDEPPTRNELVDARRLIERDFDIQAATMNRREQEILPVRAYTQKLSTAQNRYLQLQTNYNASSDLLKTLRERLAELQIELAGEVERMMILEPPEPPLGQSSPRLSNILIISTLFGTALGVLIMLIQIYKRDAFRSLDEVERTFAAPTIAIVSDIRKNLHGKFAWSKLPVEIQEAYRRAYSAVFVMPEDSGSKALMITSSIPGEGKTTTSLYIAAAATEEGRKTLVIDLDFRKRSVSRYLNLTKALGVYSVFRGEATFDEAITSSRESGIGFDILTTDGRKTSSDSSSRETLSAAKVRDLISVAKEKYDVVIVDVPPILAVQDANMVGRMVDVIFNIVSTQALQKKAAQRAAKEWRRAGLKISGLIVRGKKNELHEYYDYGYYHYDYALKDELIARRPSKRRRKNHSADRKRSENRDQA